LGFANTSDYRKALIPAVAYFKIFYNKMYNKFDNIMSKYQNLLIQKRYSKNTLDIYLKYFYDFLLNFKNRDIENIPIE
jgi:hypothetical protein